MAARILHALLLLSITGIFAVDKSDPEEPDQEVAPEPQQDHYQHKGTREGTGNRPKACRSLNASSFCRRGQIRRHFISRASYTKVPKGFPQLSSLLFGALLRFICLL